MSIIVNIIANNKTITYGDNLPTLDYQISFVDGNDPSGDYISDIIIGNNPLYVENLQNGQANYDPTQTYSIIVDTTKFTVDPNSSNNFTFNFTNGTLTVNKKNLTVTVNNIRKNYDGQFITSSDCSVSITGFVFSDNQSSLNGTLVYSGNAFTNKDATRTGNYEINASGFLSDKYTFSYVFGQLIIDPISLKLQVNNVEKTYDGIPFSSTSCSVDTINPINSTNYVSGESFSDLTGTIIYDGTSINAILAKTDFGDTSLYYTITASGISSNNYNVELISGKLFIYRKDLTITAQSKNVVYSGTTLSPSDFLVSFSGFISGENQSNLNGSLAFNSECLNAKDYNINGYDITPSGYTSNNYKITYVSGTLTISKKNLAYITRDRNNFPNGNPSYTYGVTWDSLDYTPYYTIEGFVNGEDVTTANITGKPTFWLEGLNTNDKITVKNYNTRLISIGTLSANNYTFSIDNSRIDYYPYIIINKATLTLSPKQPTSNYTYGDSINYTDLYEINGYVLNDTINQTSLVTQNPIVMFGNNQYIRGSKMNAGTYDISLGTNTSNLSDNNYNFQIFNPSTLPQVTINKASASIAFLQNLTATYGDSNIVKTLFNLSVIYGLKYNDNKYSSINPIITDQNISSYIRFYYNSNGQENNISSTTSAGTYSNSNSKSIALDITNYNNSALNYTFSAFSGYTLIINKKPVYVRPKNITTTIPFGTTKTAEEIKLLWEVTGFINGETQESEINNSTVPQVVLRKYPVYQDFYYTGQIVEYNSQNYGLYVNKGSLSANTTSNYYVADSDNSTLGLFVVTKITFDSVNLKFDTWKSFLPHIPYGVGLTPFQLNIESPKEPYLNKKVGTVTFVGQEINTGTIDNTRFALNGTPDIGVYRLTALLTIDNPNYVLDTRTVTNNSYTLEILKNIPLITHWNPAPIPKNSLLTSVELSAQTNVSNSPNAIIYCKNDGTPINIGDVVTEDMEIIEKVDDYTNTNFYPNYTFRKQKITTL
jgi:hypothetical protein